MTNSKESNGLIAEGGGIGIKIKNGIEYQGFTWRHFGILLVCAFCMLGPQGITYTTAGLNYTPVSKAIGCQITDISLYVTFIYLANAVFAVPMAKLFNRFSGKKMVIIASLMVSIPQFCLSFCTEPWMWWVAGFIIGAGLILITHLMTAILLGRWFEKRYGLVVGISYAMTGVAGVVFNLIGQFILGADLTGWRECYQFFGVSIFLLTIPWILIFFKDRPQDVGLLPYGMAVTEEISQEIEDTRSQPGFMLKEAIRLPYFWTFLIAAGLMCAMTSMIQMFAPYVQWLGRGLCNSWLALAFGTFGELLLCGTSWRQGPLGRSRISQCLRCSHPWLRMWCYRPWNHVVGTAIVPR